MIEKSRPLRSEKHRRLVAYMPCHICGIENQSQAAHANYGKGLSIKACDSQTFPLCYYCHQWLDRSGELTREARRQREYIAVSSTREKLQIFGQWTDQVEEAYQRADRCKGEICEQQ